MYARVHFSQFNADRRGVRALRICARDASKGLMTTKLSSTFEHLFWLVFQGNEMPMLLSSHRGMLNSNQTSNSHVRIMMKASCGKSNRLPLPFDDNKVIYKQEQQF